jgi:CRP-like cAMP-binding protein
VLRDDKALRVGIEEDILTFERVPTLRILGRTALRILAIGAESRYLNRGEVLFSAGETTDGGYIVQDGSFQLEGDSRIAGNIIAGPGTLLGELALIVETKRPATATARESSTVIRISRSLFLKMLEGYPEAAHILREQIVGRARQAMTEMSDVRAMLDASASTPPTAPS